jgi:hypothetical protein
MQIRNINFKDGKNEVFRKGEITDSRSLQQPSVMLCDIVV